MTDGATGRPIPTGKLALYALPSMPHSLALLPVVNFVPAFYSDTLGLPLGMVGVMLVLTRLADLLIDPAIGRWSDRARTRIGRRRPFIIAGLPIVCVAVWFLFVPAPGAGLPWLFTTLFFVYVGFSLVDLPYKSWGAELSDDYDERSRVAAWRATFETLGTLLALGIPLALQIAGRFDTGEALFWMAVFYLIAQPLTFALTMLTVAEPAPKDLVQWSSSRAGLFVALRNPPFLRVVVATALTTAGMVVGATLNLLVVTHVIGAPKSFPVMIFAQNLAILAGVPVWTTVARRVGKHVAMAICCAWVAVCLMATFAWGPGDVWGFGVTLAVLGFALGGMLFLSWALVADVIDKDLLETGEERTATYYALLLAGSKLAIAVGVLIGTGLPALIGFQPSDPVHTPASLLGLRAVYAFAGTPLVLIAAFLLWRHPLTHAVQLATRRKIAAFRATSGAAEPLP